MGIKPSDSNRPRAHAIAVRFDVIQHGGYRLRDANANYRIHGDNANSRDSRLRKSGRLRDAVANLPDNGSTPSGVREHPIEAIDAPIQPVPSR